MKSEAPPPPKLPKRRFLVVQTVESLCEGIQNGFWQNHLPSERDLCEHLQVSRRTMRSALEELERKGWIATSGQQKRRIKPTRGRVRDAGAMKKRIGVLMPSSLLTVPSRLAFVLDSLRNRLAADGYAVHFHFNAACYHARAPGKALTAFLADHPATGWILLRSREPMQRWFRDKRIPCLILGSCAEGIDLPSVDTDYYATSHHAGGMLMRKGHRRIAFVVLDRNYPGDVASEQGLMDAIAPRKETVTIIPLRHDGSTENVCAVIDKALRSPAPPTAYVVCNAAQVLTVMMHLLRRGKRIPEDVSVVSRDNDPILETIVPPVARYDIQADKLAGAICASFRQIVDTGTASPKTLRLTPTYAPWESVGACR
ncbi:substrate-binding domain-containing protein [Prosthecobacter sp.]|uniref:substrate-binding domain-containing protein n=1 Tax=Prosthecobacter sp. TaxID=1965333 RepID=UPI00378301BD